MKNINGYDISPDMVRIGLANMYLHGFPEPNVVGSANHKIITKSKLGMTFDPISFNVLAACILFVASPTVI